MIDFICFRRRDKAESNAPSLVNRCMILKNLDLVNFLFSLLKKMMQVIIFEK